MDQMDTLTAKEADLAALPVIDLSRLTSEDARVRDEEARALRAACVGDGFFYVGGHGVAPETLEALFAAAKAFFDLPLPEKDALNIGGSPVLRGYTPLLAENTDVTARGDLHEAFDIGGTLYDGSPGEAFNRYPAAAPGLEPAMTAYWAEMLRVARALMSGFALALDLPADYFASVLTNPQAFLRVLHYPPQDRAAGGGIDADQIGIGAHSDYESLTILALDENRALQVSDGAGGWLWVDRRPGTFVVNIGDQMARWTNDLFRSTVHRAINLTGRRRYSIPFFFGPNPEALIAPLPGCAGPDRPARYEPILAGDYSQRRKAASHYGEWPAEGE
jgi:isopenicillin N synthase-like dioxygenase